MKTTVNLELCELRYGPYLNDDGCDRALFLPANSQTFVSGLFAGSKCVTVLPKNKSFSGFSLDACVSPLCSLLQFIKTNPIQTNSEFYSTFIKQHTC